MAEQIIPPTSPAVGKHTLYCSSSSPVHLSRLNEAGKLPVHSGGTSFEAAALLGVWTRGRNVSKAESWQKLNDSHKPATRRLFKRFPSNFTPLIGRLMSVGSQRRVVPKRLIKVEWKAVDGFLLHSLPPFCFLFIVDQIFFELPKLNCAHAEVSQTPVFYQHLKMSVVGAQRRW